MSLVRDIRMVGIGKCIRIASGGGNSINSGLDTLLIVDADSRSMRELRTLSIGEKINSDSESISLITSSVDTRVGVYDCIIMCIAILF